MNDFHSATLGCFLNRKPLIFAFLGLFFFTAHSQNTDPVCSLIRVTETSGLPGDTVWLEVRATIPDGLVSMQFALQWDPAHLKYLGLGLTNSELPDLAGTNFNLIQSGKLRFVWFDINAVVIQETHSEPSI